MPTPLSPALLGFVWEALRSLGLGMGLVVAAVLVLVALEGWRLIRVGRRAGTVAISLVSYALVGLLAVAASILLGWVEPNVGAFTADVSTWGDQGVELFLRLVEELPVDMAG